MEEAPPKIFAKLAALNTSQGQKILNKYLLTEIFGQSFHTDILKSKFSRLSKKLRTFAEE